MEVSDPLRALSHLVGAGGLGRRPGRGARGGGQAGGRGARGADPGHAPPQSPMPNAGPVPFCATVPTVPFAAGSRESTVFFSRESVLVMPGRLIERHVCNL